MGDKYIIEIEEVYLRDGYPDERTPDDLYRVKGFNSLVFDQRGLNKLEKYDPDKWYDRGYEQGCADTEKENMLPTDAEAYGYEKGLEDAWEAARKIVCYPPDGFDVITLREIFGKQETDSVMKSFSVDEAIAKIKAYEEKKKAEIRVGDEECIKKIKEIAKSIGLQRFFNVVDKIRGE